MLRFVATVIGLVYFAWECIVKFDSSSERLWGRGRRL